MFKTVISYPLIPFSVKTKLLLLFVFAGITYTGFCQQPEELLQQWYRKAPVEKAWLHCDRDNYVAGETIWFKAYLSSDFQPDTLSSVLYLELLHPSGSVLTRKAFPVLLASAYGQLELSDSLPAGMYQLRAYTPGMLNNGTEYLFTRRFPVIGKKIIRNEKAPVSLRLDFFPEGGNLIAGWENMIAFKATDQNGYPVPVSGSIVNGKGQEVARFSTYHDGMGFFGLNPEAGMVYTARPDAPFSGKTIPLHLPEEKGLSLSLIPHPQGGFFEIRQRVSDPAKRAAYMIGQMQHHVVFRQDLKSTADEWQGVLNTEKLNSGIMQVTVFTKEGIPLAERLFFVNNREYVHAISLRADTVSFAAKGRNHFKLQLPDTVQGSLSVSITDADYALSPSRKENIVSGLLLTGDLRGYIHNPAWYFSSVADSVQTALDLLMMTNGWRRFRWENLARQVKQPLPFSDPAYITLSGKVNVRGTKNGYSNKPLLALITAEGMKRNAQLFTTDNEGRFKIDSLLFFGNGRIFILDIKGRKSQYIDVEMNGDSLGRRYPVTAGIPADLLLNGDEEKLKRMAADADAISKANGLTLETVTLKVKKKSPTQELDEKYTNGPFSGDAIRTIDLVNTDQVITDLTIFDYLQSRVPGLVVAADGFEYSLYYRQTESMSSMGQIPMKLFLNEVETDASVIASLPPAEIALIKMYSNFVAATGNGAGGVMSIYTRKGSDVVTSTRGDIILYNGFAVVKDFYVPDYKKDQSLLVQPDLRHTIDWRPNIFVNNVNPVIPLSFNNNDEAKRFRIVVEGMTTSGKLILLEEIIGKK